MPSPGERDLDIVLFGATGFTGGLTAAYLAEHRPPDLRWAIAGRDPTALAALRDRLGGTPEVIVANVEDEPSLRRMAAASRIVNSTVGPYVRYGAPVVAACADAGTDYLDLTGEAEFVDRMYLAHHATAERTGARLIHACGFDSVPHDLGAQFTVALLPADQPIALRGYVTVRATASGGTVESALTSFSRFRESGQVHAERRQVETRDQTRRARGVRGRPGYEPAVGAWVLPLPTLDPQIVVRSARALDQYGPDFTYSHYLAVGNPLVAAGVTAAMAGMFGLAQLPPARRALLKARPAGSGPTEEQRRRNWFRVRFVARSGDRVVRTEVRGGDPGYSETSKMLAESALCLAGDPLPQTAGQVTTAVAMGEALRARLERAGVTFRVVTP